MHIFQVAVASKNIPEAYPTDAFRIDLETGPIDDMIAIILELLNQWNVCQLRVDGSHKIVTLTDPNRPIPLDWT